MPTSYNKYILFIFFTFCIISCSENHKSSIPKLNEEIFINIITDIHLTEAIISHYTLDNYAQEINKSAYYEQIFLKHNTDEELFIEALNYYSSQPTKMEFIYRQVLDKLSSMEAELSGN